MTPSTCPLSRLSPMKGWTRTVSGFTTCAPLGEYAQTEARVRNARHAYYGMISYVDDKVGQLLETLKRTGLADNTLVVFASDHGEMLGERGLWYKMSFFEASARVPLLFYAPERFTPRRVAQPVSLVDLLPTLVEIATESPPSYASVDGTESCSFARGERAAY